MVVVADLARAMEAAVAREVVVVPMVAEELMAAVAMVEAK